MRARKKLVARILKSEPLILKFKPLISAPQKTRPAGAGDQWPFGHNTVCLYARKTQTKTGGRNICALITPYENKWIFLNLVCA